MNKLKTLHYQCPSVVIQDPKYNGSNLPKEDKTTVCLASTDPVSLSNWYLFTPNSIWALKKRDIAELTIESIYHDCISHLKFAFDSCHHIGLRVAFFEDSQSEYDAEFDAFSPIAEAVANASLFVARPSNWAVTGNLKMIRGEYTPDQNVIINMLCRTYLSMMQLYYDLKKTKKSLEREIYKLAWIYTLQLGTRVPGGNFFVSDNPIDRIASLVALACRMPVIGYKELSLDELLLKLITETSKRTSRSLAWLLDLHNNVAKYRNEKLLAFASMVIAELIADKGHVLENQRNQAALNFLTHLIFRQSFRTYAVSFFQTPDSQIDTMVIGRSALNTKAAMSNAKALSSRPPISLAASKSDLNMRDIASRAYFLYSEFINQGMNFDDAIIDSVISVLVEISHWYERWLREGSSTRKPSLLFDALSQHEGKKNIYVTLSDSKVQYKLRERFQQWKLNEELGLYIVNEAKETADRIGILLKDSTARYRRMICNAWVFKPELFKSKTQESVFNIVKTIHLNGI